MTIGRVNVFVTGLLALTLSAPVAISPFGADARAFAGRTEPTDVTPWVEFEGSLWFAAEDPEHGRELWKSDGTPGGTELVKDINPNGSSEPGLMEDASERTFAVVNDQLFFTARDGTHGFELWVTDGTEAGTRMVADITPRGPSVINEIEAVGDTLFFTRYADGVTRLWKSDGTAEGTVEVPSEGPSPEDPTELYAWNGRLFFTAAAPGVGRELWKSDGTATGTELVEDIWEGEPSSSPHTFAGADTRLYFVVWDDGTHFISIYRTDGTADGTHYVSNVDPQRHDWDAPPIPHSLTTIGDRLFFADNDCTHGWELWTSDGTTEGTHVIDIRPRTHEGSCGADSSPGEFVVFRGKLYFSAEWEVPGAQLHRQSLWVSRGTRATTKEVTVLPKTRYLNGLEKTVVGDRFFFTVARGTRYFKRYLWKSDGTAAGTREVDPEVERAYSLTPVGNRVFFTGVPACEGRTACYLWKSNGTAASTKHVFR